MITKLKRFKKREGWPWCFVFNLSIHQFHYYQHSLTLDNARNGVDWGSLMNLFHYELSQWLTINKLKPTTHIPKGGNFVQVITPSGKLFMNKVKIFDAKSLTLPLGNKWDGKIGKCYLSWS